MDKHDKRLAGNCGISLGEAARILSGDIKRHEDSTADRTRRQTIEKMFCDDNAPAPGRRPKGLTPGG